MIISENEIVSIYIIWSAVSITFICTSLIIYPDIYLKIGAGLLRWCRQWRINHIGKLIALNELEKDKQALFNMGIEIEGFNESATLALPDLINEYGEEYAEQKMGEVSIIEEMY